MNIPITPGKVECTVGRKTLKATIYMNTNILLSLCNGQWDDLVDNPYD